jgi:hypothetical protein
MLAVWLWALADAVAAPKIDAAEFRNSAHTLNKGEILLHPLFMPSAYGLSDHMTLKASLLGSLLAGPQAVSLQVRTVDRPDLTVAFEPGLSATWDLSAVSIGVQGKVTRPDRRNRWNATAGLYYTRFDVEGVSGSALSLPISFGYDLVQSPDTVWRFGAQADPAGAALGAPAGAVVEGNWNHAFTERFRLSLGAAAYVGDGEDLAATYNQLGIRTPDWAVLPVPTVELWWML